MNRRALVDKATQARKELELFVSRFLKDRHQGWPRLPNRRPSSRVGRGPNASPLKVLIVGELRLELPMVVDAKRAELVASLHSGGRRAALKGELERPRVGGFAVHASRAAAALGANVSVCTVVPVPIPDRFEKFFNDHAIGRQHLRALPGKCPLLVRLRCDDGELAVRRMGVLKNWVPAFPRGATEAFDVILIDPSAFGNPREGLRAIVAHVRGGPTAPLIGLRAGSDWRDDQFELAGERRVWTFMRGPDARRLAHRLDDLENTADDSTITRCLHDGYGISRLVVHSGPQGAVMLNGIPHPRRAPACPIAPVARHGAGDILLTVTTMSSAMGADDHTSLQRGVAAATGHVAGLGLPRSLDELDAGW